MIETKRFSVKMRSRRTDCLTTLRTTAITWARTSNAEQIATNAQPPKRCHVRLDTNKYENRSGCCHNHINRRCCRRGSWQLRLESSTHRSQSSKPHTAERKHN